MTVLPEGWRRLTLGDVAAWSSGGTPAATRSEYYGGAIPWAVIGDLNDGLVTTTAATITADGFANSSAKWVPSGAILIAMYGSIGKLGIAGVNLTTNQAIAAARPSEEIEGKYLFHYLLSQRDELARSGKGATQKNIGQGVLKMWPIPVPPLDEQRRIVEILEDHLSHLDAASAALASARRRLQSLNKSFTDGLVWQDDVPTSPVNELLAEPMRNGHSSPASGSGSPGVRTLTLTAVTIGEFTERNTKITGADPKKVAALWLRPEDVLVERSNTPELVGTTRLYDGPTNWAVFPDLMIRLRANERVRPAYLALALGSERAHRALRAKAKGLAGSMPKIDQGAIGSTVIPVPGLDEQDRVLTRVETWREGHLRVLKSIQAAENRCSSLRRSLLAAAFEGRLDRGSSDLDLAAAAIEA